MLNFPNFGCHFEFWQKLKMSFMLKTVRDTEILRKFWTGWVLETLDIVPLKKVEFPDSGNQKCHLSLKPLDRAISSKFWTMKLK